MPTQFVDQEAKAREDKAAYDHQERFPQTPEDAVALLSERGYGSPESLTAALDGSVATEINLPSAENLRRANERHALGILTSHRAAVSRPVPVKEPTFNLPDPNDPGLRMVDLVRYGPTFVAQFQARHPEAFTRLEVAERRRLAGPPVR
ncbi:MAG: hypothetical protein ACYDBY_15240 [Thermoanaerobaculia bacterium]